MSALDKLPDNNTQHPRFRMVEAPGPTNPEPTVVEPNDAQTNAEIKETLSETDGRDQIVETLTGATQKIEAFAVHMITDLITRLENLKQQISLESKASIDQSTKFVSLVDQALRDARKIGAQVDAIEDNIKAL